VTANFQGNHDKLQYITSLNYMNEKAIILGTIDQKTLADIQGRSEPEPQFSIQYYGSTFISRAPIQILNI